MNTEQQQQGRIMIDLETMSTAPNAAIVAVGAVRFGVSGVGETFYRRVDLASSMAAGLVVDAETIRWWMRQKDAARAEVATLPGGHLAEVLQELAGWIRRDEEPEIWGNGAASDPVWMESAFRACGHKVPWRHWQVRCFRTLRAMLPWVTGPERTGTGHHALHDAVAQAHHAVALLREMARMRAVLWPAVESHEAPCVACGDTGTAAEPDGAGGWRPVPCGCWLGRVAADAAIRQVPISPGGPPIMAAPLAAAGPHLRVVDNSPAAKAAEANDSAETAGGFNGGSAALCAVAPGDSVLRTGVSSLPGDFFSRRLRRDQED